jgi:hypothetical protein
MNIAVFAYRRADNLHRCITALQKNELSVNSDLIVFIDGPKSDASTADQEGIRGSQIYAEKITGFKSVSVRANEHNLGIIKQIFYAFDYLFTKAENWVVVEDDIEVGKYFLEYMQEAFSRYGKSQRIAMIHGYVYYNPLFRKANRAYFGYRSRNKAFGMTRTYWQNVERDARFYVTIKNNRTFEKGYVPEPVNIEEVKYKKLVAWDQIVYLNAKGKKLLCLSIDHSLAHDHGWEDDMATFTFGENVVDNKKTDPDYRVTKFPSSIKVNKFLALLEWINLKIIIKAKTFQKDLFRK